MKKRYSVIAFVIIMIISGIFTGCGGGEQSKTKDWSNLKTITLFGDEFYGNKGPIDANGGMRTQEGSINAKNGIDLDFRITNDPESTRAAILKGEAQGAYMTINRLANEWPHYKEAGVPVQVIYVSNRSYGADGLICKNEIKTARDLVGRKVGIPEFSEAQTIYEYYIAHSGLTQAEINNIEIVPFSSPDEAATALFSGEVDLAATWDPYIQEVQTTSDEFHVLFDTSMASNLCANALVVRKDLIDQRPELVLTLIDGLFEALPLYNDPASFDNLRAAMPFMEPETNESLLTMASRITVCGCPENLRILRNDGKEIYKVMCDIWESLGVENCPDDASILFNDTFCTKLLDKYPTDYQGDYSLTAADVDAIEEEDMSIFKVETYLEFKRGTAQIIWDETSTKNIQEFLELAKMTNLYIVIDGYCSKRTEGTTDEEMMELSIERAEAVKQHFIKNGVSEGRFLIYGHGDTDFKNPENPAARENRRVVLKYVEKPKNQDY